MSFPLGWAAAPATETPQHDVARGVERQLTRIRRGVWLVLALLGVLWLTLAYRSYHYAEQEQRTQVKIAAASVRAQLDNALRHMDDILAYTYAAFARHGPGLIDSDTLAQVRGRQQRNPYRQVLITTAAGDPLLSIPPRPMDAPLHDIAQAQSLNTSGNILSHVVQVQGEGVLARSMALNYSDGTFAGMAVALLDPELVHYTFKSADGSNAPAMQLLLGATPLGNGWGNLAPPRGAPKLILATEAPDLMVQAWVNPSTVLQTWLTQLWWPSFFMCWVVGLFLWGSHNLSRSLRQELHSQRLSDQRAIEARVHAMFIANISHEIRTPMNGVLGACDLLAASALDPQQTEWIGLMRRSGENLMGIINDILDFSRLEAGHFQLETKPFALRQALKDSCAALATAAKDKGLRFHCELSMDDSLWVNSDAVRLRQIVLHLLGNAIKFTDAGQVQFKAHWHTGLAGPQLHLQVHDSGIGMDTTQIDRLYNPFQQADSSHARRYGGTGLGLSITQHLVGLLRGTLSVHSTPGVGSVFDVHLPLALANPAAANDSPSALPAPTPAPSAPASANAPAPFKGTKVLVVEDHPVNQTIIRAMLTRMGCEIDVADNGVHALRAFEQNIYDLVLMDCQMPEMDGFETTRAMRRREALNPTLGRVPVIALTALAMQGDAERCYGAGMDDYLTKPVQIDQLSAKIAHWRERDNTPMAPGLGAGTMGR